MKNIAVILAGGKGQRMGGRQPKQLLTVNGKSVLAYSIDTFAQVDAIDEIAVVAHPDYLEPIQHILSLCTAKPTRLVEGGDQRYMSSLNAIMAYIDYPDDTNLIIHDAARPNLAPATVEKVIDMLGLYQAVGVGVPATDTLWEIAMNQEALTLSPADPYCLLRVPERKRYWQAQTPQAFRLPLIRDAYQRALQDINFQATDDCSVVSRYMPEVKIHLLQGDYNNLKITHPADLETFRHLLAGDGTDNKSEE